MTAAREYEKKRSREKNEVPAAPTVNWEKREVAALGFCSRPFGVSARLRRDLRFAEV